MCIGMFALSCVSHPNRGLGQQGPQFREQGAAAPLKSGTPDDAGVPPIVRVSSDGRDIEIRRASDSELVRVHVLDHCGDPTPGPPRITGIAREKENIIASYGKHCWATISLTALSIECTACD